MPTVLITGASRGIGLEFARQYAADGWRVVATCRNPAKAKDLRAVEGDVSVHALDVDDPKSAKKLAHAIGNQAIDVLLNNAGVYGPKPNDRTTQDFDAWGAVLRTNVMGPLAVTAALLGNVKQGQAKTVATISSRMGSIAENDSSGEFIYRSSKAAVNQVMKGLANDLGPDGITVVMFHPGWVQTDMGGANAHITPAESVTGMRAVIGKLKRSDNGRFLNYDGGEIPW